MINQIEDVPYVEILGSHVPVLDLEKSVQITERLIQEYDGKCSHIINTGFHGIWEGHKNPGFREVLNSAEFWVPDGISFALIASAKKRRMRRIAGPEYVKAFLELSEERGYRQFFFGDTPETLDALKTKLAERYPDLQIAGMFSPPFRELSSRENDEHVEMINQTRPHVLWVGLGCPKQERWIHDNKEKLDVPVAVGIGAIFRFLSETVSRAPALVGKVGLEWLWRLGAEPRKCWRRCLIDGPQFVFHVGIELAGLNRKK